MTPQLAGCLLSALLLLGLLLGVAVVVDNAIGHITDYKIVQTVTNGDVEIARIQAQDHITVACMQNSWFTSMKSCIDYGGVNGVGGFNWWSIGGMVLVAAAYGWWRTQEA